MDRKRHILRTARRLFDQRGYEAVTVEEIARKAKISKGLVYYYFSSKSELLGALQLEEMDNLKKNFFRAIEKVNDPAKRIVALGRIYTHYLRKHFGTKKTVHLFEDHLSLDQLSDELQNEIARAFKALLDIIRSAVQQGMDSGKFRKDLNPTNLALVFWGAAVGIHGLGKKLGPDLYPRVHAVAEEFLKVLPLGLVSR